MSRSLVVVNPKAGAGKTTTAVSLAHAYALSGESTLVVDLDPQGVATSMLGVQRMGAGLFGRIIHGEDDAAKAGLLVRSVEAGLDLIPADVDGWNSEVDCREGLGRFVETLSAQYRWVILDCPSDTGPICEAAVALADHVLLAMAGSLLARDSIAWLHKLTKSTDEAESRDETILITMFRGESSASSQLFEEARESFGDSVTRSVIPWDNSLPRAAEVCKTVFQHAPESPSARAYVQLAKEVRRHVR